MISNELRKFKCHSFPYPNFDQAAANNTAALLKPGGRFEMHTGKGVAKDEAALNQIAGFLEKAGFKNILLADWNFMGIDAAPDVTITATKN